MLQSEAAGFARALASVSRRGSLARGCVDDERSAIRVLIVTSITVVLVLLAVGVHYEALSRASNGIRRLGRTHRIRVAVAVLAALVAHFVEVILFAFGWEILLANGEAELSIENPSFAEILYFSASTYTSLSGVLREMRVAVPAQIAGGALGLALWLTGLFVPGGAVR